MEQQQAAAPESEEEEIEGLPFPNARVVKILKDNMKREHQIKKEARIEANKFLGEIAADIAKSMDNEEFFTLSVEHFNKAARKYREVGLTQKRIERIKKILEKQRAEIDEIISEIALEHSPGKTE
ncbi:MAG: hypothetical protein NTY90_03545 [Candidatus Micrarchaeota archaeon]|nr:hypothetical protein [Candidatus Micrarchaeota archaeon]